MNSLIKNKSAFTLVEMITSMVLMSTVLLAMYTAFQGIVINQARLQSEIDLNTHGYYATEKLVQLIKDGGSIDYEEYWNRRVRGYDRGFFAWDSVGINADRDYYDTSIASILTAQQLLDSGAEFTYANLGYFGNVVPGIGIDPFFDHTNRDVTTVSFGAATSPSRDYDFLYCGSNFFEPNNDNGTSDLLANVLPTDNCFGGRNNRPGQLVSNGDDFFNDTSGGINLNLDSKTLSGPVQKYGQYEIFHIDTNFDQDSNYGESDVTLPFDSGDPDVQYNPLEAEGIAQIGFTDGPKIFGCVNSPNAINGPSPECPFNDFYSTEDYGMPELYLTRDTSQGRERTYFRHIYRQDSSFLSKRCSKRDIDYFNDPGLGGSTGQFRDFDLLDGCFGTIQIAKLISVDEDYDGNIDWWKPHPDYQGIERTYDGGVFGSSFADVVWVDVFPQYVNVLDAKFLVAPSKNQEYVGLGEGDQIPTSENLIQPYLRINLTLGVGGSKGHLFTTIDKKFLYSTIVNLED